MNFTEANLSHYKVGSFQLNTLKATIGTHLFGCGKNKLAKNKLHVILTYLHKNLFIYAEKFTI